MSARKVERVLEENGSKQKARQKVVGFGNLACRKSQRDEFISAEEEPIQACDRRSALRESLLKAWRVGISQTLRMREVGR